MPTVSALLSVAPALNSAKLNSAKLPSLAAVW
jgi:hypothetical protein